MGLWVHLGPNPFTSRHNPQGCSGPTSSQITVVQSHAECTAGMKVFPFSNLTDTESVSHKTKSAVSIETKRRTMLNSTHTQCHFNGREISQGHFRPLIKKDLYSKKLKKVGLHHARLGTKRRRKTWIESNIITSLPSLLYSKTSVSLIPSIPCIHTITLPYIT